MSASHMPVSYSIDQTVESKGTRLIEETKNTNVFGPKYDANVSPDKD